MNAYEKRKLQRQQANSRRYAERKSIKLLERDRAEKFYIEAFIALNLRAPRTIPKVTVDELTTAACLMYARLHELEMGEGNEG